MKYILFNIFILIMILNTLYSLHDQNFNDHKILIIKKLYLFKGDWGDQT